MELEHVDLLMMVAMVWLQPGGGTFATESSMESWYSVEILSIEKCKALSASSTVSVSFCTTIFSKSIKEGKISGVISRGIIFANVTVFFRIINQISYSLLTLNLDCLRLYTEG